MRNEKQELTVDSNVNNVSTSRRRRQHRRSRDTRGVVRVDVDGEIRVLLADSTDETVSSLV